MKTAREIALDCVEEANRPENLHKSLIGFIEQAIRSYGEAVREAAAKRADSFTLIGPAPIGPLFGAGWEKCREEIASAIRSLELK